VKVEELFQKHRGNYGSPRITAALRQQGLACNRKRIERLMRQKGLQARIRKRFRVLTTDSHHDGSIALNLLPERTVTAPDQVWCVDITYVPTSEGWLYLAECWIAAAGGSWAGRWPITWRRACLWRH
jgi:transposase InsO family protein